LALQILALADILLAGFSLIKNHASRASPENSRSHLLSQFTHPTIDGEAKGTVCII